MKHSRLLKGYLLEFLLWKVLQLLIPLQSLDKLIWLAYVWGEKVGLDCSKQNGFAMNPLTVSKMYFSNQHLK